MEGYDPNIEMVDSFIVSDSAPGYAALDARVTTLEGQNLDSRLDVLEAQNLDSRLDAVELDVGVLEGQNLDSRLTTAESNIATNTANIATNTADIATLSSAGGNKFTKGGDAYTAATSLGSTNAFDTNLIRGGATQATITSTGITLAASKSLTMASGALNLSGGSGSGVNFQVAGSNAVYVNSSGSLIFANNKNIGSEGTQLGIWITSGGFTEKIRFVDGGIILQPGAAPAGSGSILGHYGETATVSGGVGNMSGSPIANFKCTRIGRMVMVDMINEPSGTPTSGSTNLVVAAVIPDGYRPTAAMGGTWEYGKAVWTTNNTIIAYSRITINISGDVTWEAPNGGWNAICSLFRFRMVYTYYS